MGSARSTVQILAALALMTVSMPAFCEGDDSADSQRWLTRSGYYYVSFESTLEPLQINTIHRWRFLIQTADGKPVTGAQIDLTGGMPKHDHGLPTEPRMTAELGDGYYALDGMRFHMMGEWELYVSVAADGRRDTVVIPLTI